MSLLKVASLLFTILVSCKFSSEIRNQSAGIRGKFRCGEDIPHSATIELWDEDLPLLKFFYHYIVNTETPDPDDKLDTVFPDDDGNFMINVTHNEISDLSLYMVVYHQCDDMTYYKYNQFQKGNKFLKWRRFVLRIPPEYVNTGNKAKRIFDIGVWNLQFQFMTEVLITNCGDFHFKECPTIFPHYSPFLELSEAKRKYYSEIERMNKKMRRNPIDPLLFLF